MKSPIKLAKKQNNQHTQPTQPPKQAAMPTMRTQLKKQNPLPNPTGQKREKRGQNINNHSQNRSCQQTAHIFGQKPSKPHSPATKNTTPFTNTTQLQSKKQKNNWHTIEFSNNT
ncbi:hypothetical protein NXS13_09290, partial [Corynebacterium sp. ES2730-CONJ]|uniref:hypothetical protein n=1 Tax=Corynebacterium sp. ES2730-CONJ TaxID=2973941 RepID=UPI00216B30E5